MPPVVENLIGWHDDGTPFGYSDWVEQLDGSFARTYLQPQTKSWDDVTYDAVVQGGICLTVPQVATRDFEMTEPDDPCSEGNTEWLAPILGAVYDVNGPQWGDWYNPLNGISYRDGVQAIAVDWTQEQVDVRNGAHCDWDSGTDEAVREIQGQKCSPKWTGEWIITILQKKGGKHYRTYCTPYVPDEADTNGDGRISEKEAKAWKWSAAYLAQLCALPCETQDWEEGKVLSITREFIDICGVDHPEGTLFSGNHCDTSLGTPGNVCDWLGEIQ